MSLRALCGIAGWHIPSSIADTSHSYMLLEHQPGCASSVRLQACGNLLSGAPTVWVLITLVTALRSPHAWIKHKLASQNNIIVVESTMQQRENGIQLVVIDHEA